MTSQSETTIGHVAMMALRGICVPPAGGAQKNANAFVLADAIMSVDNSRRLYDHSVTDLLPIDS